MHYLYKELATKEHYIMTKKKNTVGRKKIDTLDKKIPVQVYITGKRVKEIGGIEKAREISLNSLNNFHP